MDFIKSKTYKFFYGSCNINGDLKLNKLADVFSELADEQVDALKNIYPFLDNKQYRWILVRYNIRIDRMMQAEEIFKVITYQSYYSRYSCIREYSVEDDSGKEIIAASCQWVMKNVETGGISVIPKEYSALTAEKERKILDLPKIDDFTCAVPVKLYTRFDDYDYNGHVNNAKYFSFIEDERNLIDQSKYRIAGIDINYKSGMIYGNEYMICNKVSEAEDCIILHQKIYDSDTTAALMRSRWMIKR